MFRSCFSRAEQAIAAGLSLLTGTIGSTPSLGATATTAMTVSATVEGRCQINGAVTAASAALPISVACNSGQPYAISSEPDEAPEADAAAQAVGGAVSPAPGDASGPMRGDRPIGSLVRSGTERSGDSRPAEAVVVTKIVF